MENLVELLHKSVANIENEHEKISEYIRKVENYRHSLLAHVNALNDESGARIPVLIKLKESLEGLEVRLEKTHGQERLGKNEEKIKQGTMKIRKCRYHNRGFCKMKEECEFLHSENICEKYLQDGKCLQQDCPERHPKDCRYWVRYETGFSRRRFLHVSPL